MCSRCNYLVETFPITFYQEPSLECLRPDGHRGDHVVRNERGKFYAWVPDPDCDCEDGGCGCIIYGEIEGDEAARLIAGQE